VEFFYTSFPVKADKSKRKRDEENQQVGEVIRPDARNPRSRLSRGEKNAPSHRRLRTSGAMKIFTPILFFFYLLHLVLLVKVSSFVDESDCFERKIRPHD
jgi:hypothetical protein